MIEDRTIPDKAVSSKSTICATRTAAAIDRLLASCHHHRLIGVVIGEPGTGKTTAAGDYTARRRDAVYCRIPKSADKLQPGLLRIGAALGGYTVPNASANDAYFEVVRALQYREGALLILDEAQHMADDLLEAVRDLYDEGDLGLALIGNPELAERWSGRGNRQRYGTFAQLRGRLGPQLELPRPLTEDIEAVIRHHGIDGKASEKLLTQAAGRPGGLHNVEYVLRAARSLAGDGKPLSFGVLKDAAVITGASS